MRFIDGLTGIRGVNLGGWLGTLNFVDDREHRPFKIEVWAGITVSCPTNRAEALAQSPGGRLLCYVRTADGFNAKYTRDGVFYAIVAADPNASAAPQEPSRWAIELVDELR